ncbi:vacuolar protein sorting-associated protein 41 homolog isoform X2 [Artemia franciscana]
MAVHSKFLCVGFKSGKTLVFDHLGNINSLASIPLHAGPINQISIDEKGEHVATCSDDGKVAVTGLVAVDNSVVIIMDRPVKSIAIDPSYYRSGSGRRIVTGDDRLTLHEKNFFSRYRSSTLHEGEGIVNNIQWRGRFLAWATAVSVRVYDIVARRTISLIKREHKRGSDWEKMRCQLYWRDDLTLVVGWGTEVKVCRVRKRYDTDIESRELPNFLVEILSMFVAEFTVCGLGHIGDQLTILSSSPDGTENPVLRTVEYHPESYTETSLVEWPLQEKANYTPNDFHLLCLSEEFVFFLVSPKSVVIARQRDAEDHIQWLLDHGMFEEALSDVSQPSGRNLKKYSRLSIGRSYIDFLLDKDDYEKAASVCEQVLGKDKILWEQEFSKFLEKKQLRAICQFLPVDSYGILSSTVYEAVLIEFLYSDSDLFLELISKWPKNIYRVELVINETLKYISSGSNDEDITLLTALALLYINQGGYEKAMTLYLKLQRSDVFYLIQKHRLFKAALFKVSELMDLDPSQTVTLLTDNIDLFPVEVIVSKLSNQTHLLFLYLDALYQRDSRDFSRPYHNDLLNLYAEFGRGKLLPFLKTSDFYSIPNALDILKEKDFVPELIYILDRMGNIRDALDMIVTRLRDIDQAIEFCQRHDDRELWDQLLGYATDNPDFVLAILHKTGTKIDPKSLIERIGPKTEIPGLRNVLVEILRDFSIQIELEENCQKVLVGDCFNLQEKLMNLQKSSLCIEGISTCHSCSQRLIMQDEKKLMDIVMFKCNHSFHKPCLGDQVKCLICTFDPTDLQIL